MPNHRALAIANEFIRLNEPMPMSSQMWLQKLVYIAQGWNLAINDEPLVREDVQAWDQGPVFRSIWDHIRDFGVDRNSHLLTDPSTGRPYVADLTDDERAVIRHVWKKYRDFTGKELSVKTHMPGTPWTSTYLDEGRNSEIPKAVIRRHYRTLAAAGRDRAKVHTQ